jgi:16S rRNA C1402 N4-methylase RsmH
MREENESEQVAQIFTNLGAEEKVALQMARQLTKRAEQRSRNENISKTAALRELLEVAVYGAQGMLKPSDQADLGAKND